MEALEAKGLGIFLYRKKFKLVLVYILVTAIFVGVSYLIPRTYKAPAIVSIDTQYFQLPLVRGFVSENQSDSEKKARREAILWRALNSQFIQDIGNRYGLLEENEDPFHLAQQQESLDRKFEVFSRNSTTFSLAFLGQDAKMSQQITEEMVEQVRKTLVHERKKRLKALKASLESRLKNLESGSGTFRLRTAKNAIDKLDAERRNLGEGDPRNRELDERANLLRSFSSSTEAKESDVYMDLDTKLQYVSVALSLENEDDPTYFTVIRQARFPSSPIKPKRLLFLIAGLVVSTFMCLVWALFGQAESA